MQRLSTIVQINPNQEIDDRYFESLLKAGTTIWGMALVSGGKITINRSNDPTLQKIKDVHDVFKDKDLTLHFSNDTPPVDPKSRQPFVLATDADGKPAIVAFVEGDYKAHALKDGIGSDEYYMVQEVLQPLVTQFWDLTSSNVEGTMKLMSNTMQEKIVRGAAGERGTVVLMASTGQIHTITDNDQDATFPWGDVSRHHDFGHEQEVIQQPEPEVKKEMTPSELMALAMGGSAEEAPVTGAKSPAVYAGSAETAARIEEKKRTTAEILAVAAKEAKGTTADTSKPTHIRIPVPTESNSKRKDFFDKVLRIPRPAGWETMSHIDVPYSQCPPKFLPKAVDLPETLPAKDTTTQHVTNAQTATKPNGSVPAVPAAVIVPIIPIAQIKAFKDTFLNSVEMRAVIQSLGGKVPGEKELQEMEAKFPSWAKQTATPLLHMASVSHAGYVALCKEYPNLAASLLGEFGLNYLRNYKEPAAAIGSGSVPLAQDNQRAIGGGSSKRR